MMIDGSAHSRHSVSSGWRKGSRTLEGWRVHRMARRLLAGVRIVTHRDVPCLLCGEPTEPQRDSWQESDICEACALGLKNSLATHPSAIGGRRK